jgi:uncharacterized RDD family membrane protein YckC
MSLSDETLQVNTPENVVFGYQIAGIGSRFLAALVDTSLILLLELVVALVMVPLVRQFGANSEETNNRLVAWGVAISVLIAFAVLWTYYIFFELIWNGQSPGKRWVGLRVMRSDGTPVTLLESLVRNLLRLVDFLPFAYGIGVVTMFLDHQGRRLGDLAAGVLVVFDRKSTSIQDLMPQSVDIQGVVAFQNVPIEKLTAQELRLIEDFLRRREQLANRMELANRIAFRLRERLSLSPADLSWPDSEEFLSRLYLTAQNSHKS